MKPLTSEELIALNTLIDGKPIFGINLKASDVPEEERLELVQKSLSEKEYIYKDELTDLGIISTKFLSDYKEAEAFVFINDLRIGLMDEEAINMIDTENQEYIFQRTHKMKFLYQLSEAVPYLRGKQEKRFFGFEEESMDMDGFVQKLKETELEWKGILIIQKYKEKVLKRYETYYYNDDVCYRYDHIKEKNVQRGSQDFRNDLMGLMEVGRNLNVEDSSKWIRA